MRTGKIKLDLWELPPIDPSNKNSANGFAESVNWLPGPDSQQNFFVYSFGFLMIPTQINNPKPSYCLLREKNVIAIYHPFVFFAV